MYRREFCAHAAMAAVMSRFPVWCPPAKYKVNDLVELHTGAVMWIVKHEVKGEKHFYGLALSKGGQQVAVVPETAIQRKVK